MSTKHENSVALVGEITKDIFTKKGNTNGYDWNMASFSLLTEIPTNTRSIKTYHNVSSFGEVADKLKGIGKGATVKVIGSIGSYKDKDENWKQQIIASLIEVLSVPKDQSKLADLDEDIYIETNDEDSQLPF